MAGVYALNRKTIKRRIERDKNHEDESYKDIFKMILLVVTPFIISTGIYNVNTFLDNNIYQRIMMEVRNLEEAIVATDLSTVAKGTKISNIPIALASAMATALIPGISSDFVQGDLKGVRGKVAKAVKVTMLISIPCAVGLGVLAKPVMMVIFHQPETLEISSVLLSCMSVSVIFYSLSTLTQAILQSIGRMKTPIINALAAVLIHAGVMVAMMLLMDEKYSLYYYVFATVLYSFILCILNQIAVHRYLKYSQEITKTFFIPVIAAGIMGGTVYGVYQGLYFLCKINIAALAAAIIAGAAVYFVLVIHWRAVSEAEMRGMPKGHMMIAIAKKMGILKRDTEKKKKGSGKKKTSSAKKKTAQKQVVAKEKAPGDKKKFVDQADSAGVGRDQKISEKWDKDYLDMELDDNYWLDD